MHARQLAALALSMVASGFVNAGSIEPNLTHLLAQTPGDGTVSALLYLSDRVVIDALDTELAAGRASRGERNARVVGALQLRAAATQGALLERLRQMRRTDEVSSFQPLWIVNAIRVDGRPGAIEELAGRVDVAMAYINYDVELIREAESGAVAPPVDEDGGVSVPMLGLTVIRAPEAWAAGYRGEGVVVANIDTGVSGDHPALADRWRGLQQEYSGHPEWAWFDPYLNDNDFPYDSGGHGTHTMGTIVGGAPGDEIGAAPGATWIAAAPIDRSFSIQQTVTDVIESFQWIVNPDGDADTVWDVPHVCGNSWGVTTVHGYPPCDQLFWTFIDASEAAGTAHIFAAGNEGTNGLRRPADRALDGYRSTAIAAVDATFPGWPVAAFSSRGPTFCTPDGSAAIKPDIAAPGVSVRSAAPGGGYTSKSGTSMATPHVVGAMALVFQACPALSVDQAKQVLYDTARDLGTLGKDNEYGWGLIDANAAVQRALLWCDSCSGDVNNDKNVDQGDLGIVLAYYGCTGGSCGGDVDGDGDTDQSDLGIVISHYGSACE